MGLFGNMFGGGSAADVANTITGAQPDQSFGSRLQNYLSRVQIGVGFGPVAAKIGEGRSRDMDEIIKGMIQKYNTTGSTGGGGGNILGGGGGGGGGCSGAGGTCTVQGINTNETPMSGTTTKGIGGDAPVYRQSGVTDFSRSTPKLIDDIGRPGLTPWSWGR